MQTITDRELSLIIEQNTDGIELFFCVYEDGGLAEICFRGDWFDCCVERVGDEVVLRPVESFVLNMIIEEVGGV